MNFRPRSPVVPHLVDSPTNQGVDEVRRAVEQTASSDVVNGRLTDAITLSAYGTAQTINHGLGRTPLGFHVYQSSGIWPEFYVTGVDSKRISLVSLERFPVSGSFTTSPTGAVTASTGYGWTCSRTAAGVYTFTLSVSSSAMGAGSLVTALGNADRVFRYTSYTAPSTVVWTHWDATPAASNAVSTTVLVDFWVTGTAPKFKLWVF